jgi:hypothetical protein
MFARENAIDRADCVNLLPHALALEAARRARSVASKRREFQSFSTKGQRSSDLARPLLYDAA